mmetsp:Transcript_394/g.598  ORF Transcript_394/g.598 Transcript_394/m.598 type:complete len:160 (+) Transcript_394:109-588(+)
MTKTGYVNIPTGEEPIAVAIMDDDVTSPSLSTTSTEPPPPPARNPAAAASTTITTTSTTSTTTTRTGTTTSGVSMLGRTPLFMDTCPKCGARNIRTSIKTYPSALTWILVGIAFMLFWPLCWIPLVLDSMKQTDHYCQSCNEKVGTVKALADCCVKEMH